MDAVAPCFIVGLNIALARSSRLERLALKSCSQARRSLHHASHAPRKRPDDFSCIV